MANEIITTLHPDQDPDTNLYPNIKKDNVPNGSIDRSKLDDGVNSLLDSINELKPSGVDTSTNILAFTTNKGIYIGSNTGHWYYWDGTHYVDGGVYQSTQVPDGSIGKAQVNNTIVKQWNYSNYKDFNTARKNSIIVYSALQGNESEYSNYPVSINGTLISLNGYDAMSDSNNIGDIQLYITYTNRFFYRSSNVGTFTGWKEVTYLSLLDDYFKAYWGQNTTYKDFNTAPNNSVICYSNTDFTGYSNYPVDIEGTLITFNGFSTSLPNIAKTQYYLTRNNRLFTRISWGGGGTFTSWKEYATRDDDIYIHIYDDYIHPIYDFNNKSIVFFGDSITRGVNGSNESITRKPYPQLFAEHFTNVTYYNQAWSGSSIYNDGTHTYLRQQLEGFTHKTDVDYVFIASGVNDWGYGHSLSDVQTTLGNDIDYVLNNYPNAKIILITPINPNYTKSDQVAPIQKYRNIITECGINKDFETGKISIVQGNKFDFPNVTDNTSFRNNMYADGLHPTTQGYETAYINGLLKALIK